MSQYSDFKDRVQKYDPELYLGHLCWYAVSDEASQDHTQFVANIKASGVDFYLPKEPSADDIFRRVTTLNARKKVSTADPAVFNNFFFTEVGADSEAIHKTLVMQTVDTAGHELGHQNIWQMVFEKDSKTITTRSLLDPAYPTPLPGHDIVKSVQDDFRLQHGVITPSVLRSWIRRAFEHTRATVVRPSGGVYFVAKMYGDQMEALKGIVNVVPGASIHSLPLIDDTEQRAMLKQAFTDESVGELDALITEVRGILSQKKGLSPTKRAHFIKEWKRIASKVQDYSQVLDDELEKTVSRCEIFQHMVAGDLLNMLEE